MLPLEQYWRVRTRSSPWFTSELKKRMHDRDILKLKASKRYDSGDWTLFKKKKQRNIVISEIRLAKQAYYQNSLNEYMDDSKKDLSGRLSMHLNGDTKN